MKNTYSLNSVDVLIRNRSILGAIDHYGDFTANNWIIDNHLNCEVSQLSIRRFLKGSQPDKVKRFNGRPNERNQVVQMAYSMISRNYHVTQFNHERFANLAWGKGRKSKLVNVTICIFLIAVAGMLVGNFSKVLDF